MLHLKTVKRASIAIRAPKACARMQRSSRQGKVLDEWPFAALGPVVGGEEEQQRQRKKKSLRGVVFDVDGTLCLPQNYMFKEMRDALDIPKTTDILDHIESLPPAAQDAAQDKIRAIERRAMALQTPQPGLAELMAYLDARGVRKAICTRNFEEPVTHLLTSFLPPATRFSPILTRSFKPPKPSPAGILHIAREWGAAASAPSCDDDDDAADDAAGLVMVGDSADDMVAGARAGAVTVLLAQDAVNAHVRALDATDFCVHRLDEIITVLETGELGVGGGT